ncbi:LOW QUALITY PROTEIN: acyl carrier protein 2, chloroplastic-like [Chenopodium quinoa]|uniref:LOW QUALITY PROTEIN: acyl carrier protein 2, chloroplastic-like n=1 Tax=Chenopodium quinoa TaxID=63459 RepID=UPI000B77C79F|nr:LOW QUALITY PROTEIN: acyl carrier protein 2, chloroplastic-like [Chenopodium quinoa]
MASLTSSSVSFKCAVLPSSFNSKNHGLKSSVSFWRANQVKPRGLSISCAAKPETLEKVSSIVREQLAMTKDTKVTGETKFSEIGADSLDTVEIVMKLEEEFGVTVEEENAQTITTIQEAADMIEKLQNK